MESASGKVVTFDVSESTEERLSRLELVASKGLKASLDGFAALGEIRDDRLYLARGYTTWESYCKEVWGISPNYAYKQIQAVECRERVCTMVHTTAAGGLDTERQLRELQTVPDESLNDVLEEADVLATESGASRLTADILKKARVRVLGGRKKKKKPGSGKKPAEPFVLEVEPLGVPDDKLRDSRAKALKALEQARRHMGILGLDQKWDKTLNKMMDDVEELL